ncbi:MAG: PstS family phosphate ABC transporter substrate-binding protein [Parvularculales bacterium]
MVSNLKKLAPMAGRLSLPAALPVALVVGVVVVGFVTEAFARNQIRIVGSSTVFPFATAAAENFSRNSNYRTPVVESTGTGGGMKLFCAGIGVNTPDISNASRRIKKSEYDTCKRNGVSITEVKVGYDGIVIANARSGPKMALTLGQVFQALAEKVPVDGELVLNPYKKWSDIDPSLPNVKIEVLGPPPTSGTRDAFVELAMEGGAKSFSMLAALRKMNKKQFKVIAHTIREDGAFIEAGENDNLIVRKLEENPNALGIFGFSFLDQNGDKVRGATINGVEPSFDNIAGGDYGISRSLYFYVKREHAGVVPGLEAFVEEFTSDDAWGDYGYLTDKGLIPLPVNERTKVGNTSRALRKLDL